MFFCVFLLTPLEAKRISMIRDAEIENTILEYIHPLLIAAGLEPLSIRIHIVKDNTLNAFVAEGQQIFINTGLILKSQNANQLIGVLAHEIGHISGGHLIRSSTARKNVSATSLLSVLLGGAAIIAGRPDAGAAAIQFGNNASIKNYLKFSRTQESAADHSALRILEKTQQSAGGLLQFMKILEGQELLSSRSQDPYVRTHPLNQNRITAIREHTKRSKYTNKPTPFKKRIAYNRIKAKLFGFTQNLSEILRVYPENKSSTSSIYARSIGFYRKPNIQKAIKLIDILIKRIPGDPYFHELKGQIYFENGKIELALSSYRKAVSLMRDSSLLRAQLGRVQISKNEPAFLKKAVRNLLFATDIEPTRPSLWRQLGIAYGRLEKKGESSRALAEEAVLLGRNNEAIKIAKRAKKQLKIGSPNWLRAEDIIISARENLRNRLTQK
jgi:predicted Zn-dependent protease